MSGIGTLGVVGVDFAFYSPMKETTPHHQPALQKDPDEWKTGDEPMTAAQRSYLETLATDVGQSFNEELTKADASKLIEELRQRSPRIADE